MNKRDAQRLNDVALNILDLVHCMHTGAANEITFEAWRDMFASGKEYEAARKQWQRWKEDLEENGICERVADGREDHVILKRGAVEVAEALHAEAQGVLNEGKVERRYPDQVAIAGRTYRLKVYGRAVRPLTDREYAELRASIQASGRIEVEVLVDRRGAVVDGKHRLMIAAELGLTDIPIKVLDINDPEQLETIAVDVNAFRRHLTKQQIAELKRQRQERVNALRAERKSIREIAEAEGVGVATIQRDLEEAEDVGPTRVRGRDGALRPAQRSQEETTARRQRVSELLGGAVVDEATVSEVAEELGVAPRTIWRDVKALGMPGSDPAEAPISKPSGEDFGIVVHEVRFGESCLGIDREAAPLGACLEAAIAGLEQLQARVTDPELVELVGSIHKVVESVLWRILEGATT